MKELNSFLRVRYTVCLSLFVNWLFNLCYYRCIHFYFVRAYFQLEPIGGIQ